MMLRAVAVGFAFGTCLAGAAAAQTFRMLPMQHPTWVLPVDDDDDKHGHGKKYKNRDHEDEGDDEDHGRGRRSSDRGSHRYSVPMPNYYSLAPYYDPYAPYRPYAPPVPAYRPPLTGSIQPSPSAPSQTIPNRAGSAAPSIQWVDPAPAR